MKTFFVRVNLVLLVSTLLLAASTTLFHYHQYFSLIILPILFLALAFWYFPLVALSLPVSLAFYTFFVYTNINYFFILGICLITGLFLVHMFHPTLKVPAICYALIPLFLLGHAIWFNLLPLGFEEKYTLDLTDKDLKDDTVRNLYLDKKASLGEVFYNAQGNPYIEQSEALKFRFRADLVNTTKANLFLNIPFSSETDVYLANNDRYYILNINSSAYPYKTKIGEIILLGPKANPELEASLQTADPLFFDEPHYYFFPQSQEAYYLSIDFSQFNISDKRVLLGGNIPEYKPAYTGDGRRFDGEDDFVVVENTADNFTNQSFIVQVEYKNTDANRSNQEIIGHYDWELYSDEGDLFLRMGRMNTKQGDFLELRTEHTNNTWEKAAFYYTPQDSLKLFKEGVLKGVYFIGNDTIYDQYNKNRSLTMGKAYHGSAMYYEGEIRSVQILNPELTDKYIAYREVKSVPLEEANSFTIVPRSAINLTTIEVDLKTEK